jgi:L-seryl-tRNA(Ser) seleniumtransferase
MDTRFRQLPSVEKLMSAPRLEALAEVYSRPSVVDLARQHLDGVREAIALGQQCPSINEIVGSICAEAEALWQSRPRRVINATGVILHTNLGRAPLSREAAAAMQQAATGYCNLEIDLKSGKRGSRQVHVESLLCQLTGAEAALVVNNNASAVMLALAALAKRKEVIVSRGQSVEIGGGFRIPEVMRQSGAKLVEVGTTNSTRLADYEEAITAKTAALLRVHSSNFRIVGFTQEVALEELVELGLKRDLPVLDDLGSGCLIDTSQFGLAHEPMVQESISNGVGLATLSGDKLLGGPQAGVIVGNKSLVDKLRRHQLARAVRVDKVTLAGLAETLLHYVKNEAEDKIPVWRMISMSLGEIERRAVKWARPLGKAATVLEVESVVGGGSLPGGTLPTRVLALKAQGKGGQRLAERLRRHEPPVMSRVEKTMVLLDPRTVDPEDDGVVARALHSALEIR